MTEVTAPARRSRRPYVYWGVAIALAVLLPLALGSVLILRGRRRLLGQNAVRCLHRYAGAQEHYRKNDWDADGDLEYATPYTMMVTCRIEPGVPDICHAFAAARGMGDFPFHGYRFLEVETVGGKPVDWTKDFALCATPFKYGSTGYRSFVITTDRVVWAKDLGGPEFVEDFPADPASEGWEKVRE